MISRNYALQFCACLLLLTTVQFAASQLSCADGWSEFDGSCYLYKTDTKQWFEAQLACQALSGDLATVKTAAVNSFLVNLIGDLSPRYWFGLTDEEQENNWKWTDGNILLSGDWNNWHSGEPNNGGGDGQNCAQMWDGGTWDDDYCTVNKRYICQRSKDVLEKCDTSNGWTSSNGKCYKAYDTLETWSSAMEVCRTNNGDLVSINNADEQAIVTATVLSKQEPFWIGLSDKECGRPNCQEYDYSWSDGSLFTYTNWFPGEPSDRYTGNDNCAEILETSNTGQWSTIKCDSNKKFICERDEGTCAGGWELYSGSCYQFNYAYYGNTWTNAKRYCEAQGGYLVTIGDEDENNFVETKFPEMSNAGIDSIWIGISDYKDDGNFYWANQEQLKYDNWRSSPPADISGQADCGLIFTENTAGKWETDTCFSVKSFVCEIGVGQPVQTIDPNVDVGSCPDSTWVLNGDYCYYFDASERTYQQARQNCEDLSATLASITSEDEQSFISVKLNSLKQSIWIGLDDIVTEDDYQWVDHSPYSFISFKNWAPNEPNNAGDNEDCIHLREDDTYLGTWNDRECLSREYSVCKREKYPNGGKVTEAPEPTPTYDLRCGTGWDWNSGTQACYKIFGEDKKLAFHKAQDQCEYHGGNLVSISDIYEQSYLEGFFSNVNQAVLWTGAHDFGLNDGGWRWTDESGFRFLNWNAGEPNDAGFNEDCAEIIVSSGKWNDNDCADRKAYICKKKGILTENFYVFNNMELPGNTKVELTGIMPEDCARACLDQNSFVCRSFDYHLDTQICDMTDENQNTIGPGGGLIPAYSDDPVDHYEVQLDTQCPDGWSEFDDKCYRAFDDVKNWYDSRTDCQSLGGDLVVIGSFTENNFVESVTNPTAGGLWIGFHDQGSEGQFIWIDGREDGPLEYKKWNPGEPNDYGSDEDCVEIVGGGYWNDLLCTNTRRYICEKLKGFATAITPTLPSTARCMDGWAPYGDYCYLLHTESASWANVRAACQADGGDLASIWDKQENDFIISFIRSVCNSFITDSTNGTTVHNPDLVENQRMTFEVKASMNVHIILTEQVNAANNYDIVFGDESNTVSKIKKSGSTRTSHSTPGILSTDEYRIFWITWEGGIIAVGRYGEAAFMSWRDVLPLDVYYVGYSTVGTTGDFKLCVDETGDEHTWIGLNDLNLQMSFEWSDGSEVSYTNWYNFEPNNHQGSNEDCTNMWTDGDGAGFWNDNICDQQYHGICKSRKRTDLPPTDDPGLGSCGNGWVSYLHSCYKIDTTPMSWSDAKDKCHDLNGHLITIEDQFENGFLASKLAAASEYLYWIGLNDIDNPGTYAWEHNETVTFTNWDRNQPDDTQGNCVGVRTGSSAGFWDDQVCTATMGFVCETLRPGYTAPPMVTQGPITQPSNKDCARGWTGFGSNCFIAIIFLNPDNELNWNDARSYCFNMGGDLASFHDGDEYKYIQNNLGVFTTESFWIGLNDINDGNGYTWSDGSPVNFEDWDYGEPNKQNGACVTMYLTEQGWVDTKCDGVRDFVCKLPKGITPNTTPVPPVTPPKCGTTDWSYFNGYCYYSSARRVDGDQADDWADASKWCNDHGGHLASIHSEDENDFIYQLIKYQGVADTKYWIGLREYTTEGVYSWSDNSPLDYQKWNSNEPNDANGEEQCVQMYSNVIIGDNGKYWNDENCAIKIPFICKRNEGPTPTPIVVVTNPSPGNCPTGWVEHSNKCFQFNSDKLTWSAARDMCMSRGGNLASVHTQEIQAYLTSTLRAHNYHQWIGLSDSNHYTFRWTDGKGVDYTNWAPGEPNGRNKEDCVEMYSEESVAGKWNDVSCEQAKGYVCQGPKDVSAPAPTPATGDCADGYIQQGDGCWKLVNAQGLTFDAARSYCSNDNEKADLASILDAYDNAYVEMLALNAGSPLWIGMRTASSGFFEWVDGWQVGFTFWGENQPDSDQSTSCVQMALSGGWDDTDCSITTQFVCKYSLVEIPTLPPTPAGLGCYGGWRQYGSYCYDFSNMAASVSWPDAKYSCEVNRATLVSILTPGENEFVTKAIFDSRKNLWIGLERVSNGGWGWEDNSPLVYSNWNTGEPTYEHGDNEENCVELYNSVNLYGLWNDLYCFSENGYVCKRLAGKVTTAPPTRSANATTRFPDSESSGSGKKSGGKTAGIVIGVLAGIVLLIAIVAFLYTRQSGGGSMPTTATGFDNSLYKSSGNSVSDTAKLEFNA